MLSLTLPAPLAAEALTTLDAHTEGEPLRIITGGYPPIPGSTILEKRRYLQAHLDHYRRLLMHEPRGHADMYGALLTEPTTLDGDFGVLFLHNEGYSSMCGHGILAVVQAAAKCGWFSVTAMPETINIDAPAGRIQAQVWRNGAGGIEASFINVPSWAEALDCRVEVPGLGSVEYDIGFGGAYYAYVDADALGLSCEPERLPTLISAGRAIKQAVMATHPLAHPQEADLSFLYGTLFTSARTRDPDCHSRHVCVFADGEVDRSPTGTGVAGRVALLHARNQVALGQPLMIESIVGGRMTVTATDAVDYHGKAALLPRVSGRSWITGEHRFVLEPDDPFSQGFLLR
ncbi:proline racemase family protein [Ferrimonas kyonanensis]|uniref:proline racemase family protein n=1 Tax=Ferrimonas kyonanensis TaxID=364763 RepID=UPI000421277F|nr:proline racemase family protein [Ferrimonas kyonanensis]